MRLRVLQSRFREYQRELAQLYGSVIEDYRQGAVQRVPKWCAACLRLVHKSTFPRFSMLDSRPFDDLLDDMTEDMLREIYRIEDVRPILLGLTHVDDVSTTARAKGAKLVMPRLTARRCSMVISLCGVLQMLFPNSFSYFKNLESQIMGWDMQTPEERARGRIKQAAEQAQMAEEDRIDWALFFDRSEESDAKLAKRREERVMRARKEREAREKEFEQREKKGL